MRELETTREQDDGKSPAGTVRIGNVIHIFPAALLLREMDGGGSGNTGSPEEMATEQTTVVIFEMRHKGELPANLALEMERRAYDLSATKGAILIDQKHQVLPVREMK